MNQSAELHNEALLSAYNAAFSDLGLRFRWSQATLDFFDDVSNELTRITAYIERFHAHLLNAYDADFLAQLIFDRKNQFYRDSTAQ
ncbi:hypothetical protein PPMP20_29370 [Paraburkholderia phymatum]|uniref:Uncharacterized protein n=1 Tax=Paraburkholderia phymatum (strain DSM 17167 / CIP 108236 / LMG 21445 / STM815) TaxID=391038 RepID=B2JRD9_PARP8|nr:hypothetical protein [Paraburkholderia phymatum]ACC73805.1 conserved hypothetical protein [Paraburkholderia phymatum STM815]